MVGTEFGMGTAKEYDDNPFSPDDNLREEAEAFYLKVTDDLKKEAKNAVGTMPSFLSKEYIQKLPVSSVRRLMQSVTVSPDGGDTPAQLNGQAVLAVAFLAETLVAVLARLAWHLTSSDKRSTVQLRDVLASIGPIHALDFTIDARWAMTMELQAKQHCEQQKLLSQAAQHLPTDVFDDELFDEESLEGASSELGGLSTLMCDCSGLLDTLRADANELEMTPAQPSRCA